MTLEEFKKLAEELFGPTVPRQKPVSAIQQFSEPPDVVQAQALELQAQLQQAQVQAIQMQQVEAARRQQRRMEIWDTVAEAGLVVVADPVKCPHHPNSQDAIGFRVGGPKVVVFCTDCLVTRLKFLGVTVEER